MKRLIALVLGVCLLATVALAIPVPTGDFTSGWGDCNALGNYGGWNKVSTCKVAWEPDGQGTCPENNRDATFTVGVQDRILDKITIGNLDGIANTLDSFEIKDGDTVLCTYIDATTPPHAETWTTFDCVVSSQNYEGPKQLTLSPLATAPWSQCGTYGQVAIRSITYTDHLKGSNIPEFSGIAAGLALAGAATGFILLRKKK